TTTQITDTSFLDLHLVGRITDSGRFLAWEHLSILTSIFSLSSYDRLAASENTLVSGQVNLPDLGVDFISNPAQPEAVVAFQSAEELVPPNNADTNMEIFTTRLVLPPGPEVFCSAPNLGISIPDRGDPGADAGISNTITIPDLGTIVDVNVSLLIDHSFVNDLEVRLTHDTVTNRRLVNRPRAGAGGPRCSGDDIEATIDDEGAGGDVDIQCNALAPAILSPPSYTPDQSLDVFDGGPSAGDWTINVRDRRNNNQVGTLEQWCVIITAN
ncbi:MAG: proprotein convertase P-domain-containing protein, partial [Thermoanaerobaculales bacterium]|nr:proprotein convertase P-domain-containing protein [Thermoanaerobaculales bacterium]